MVKRVLQEGVLVLAIALVAAGVTWGVIGGPDRSVRCEVGTLKEGWVCFAELEDEWDEILWIDARSRAEWQRNGIKGSVLLTDHNEENWDDLLAEAAERVFGASRVVVYCNETGCGSSQAVAEKLRSLQLTERVDVLFGGWKALRAAGITSMSGTMH